MKTIKLFLAVLISVVFLTSPAFAARYKIDPEHSTVSFKIRHLVSQTQGFFKKFEGTFDYEPGKPEQGSAEAVIDVNSLDTNVEGRDKHLRSPDFFDTEKFPAMTFKSTKFTEVSPESGKLEGVLSLHGVEKPVELDVQIHGVGNDPWGNTRSGFTASTKINRKDFGIEWNKALEKGQLLGDEVTVNLEIEGILETNKEEVKQ